jgi:hypothetical protein
MWNEDHVAEARIYKPARTAMQSGKGKTKDWVLDFDPARARRPDPLMGWSGGGDTRSMQVSLRFATREEAEAYAKRHGIDYAVVPPAAPKLKLKTYADNFRYDRAQ